jgi:parallel beta-helix repeat protein
MLNRIRRICVICVIATAVIVDLQVASRCIAATYYVSPAGSDLNNGSQGAPFRQIRAAVAVVRPGDTILVGDGTYLGFNVNGVNGSSTGPITIQATGADVNVVPTVDRTDNRDTIFVTYSSFIVLTGLHAFNANRAAIRIDNSPNVTVRNGVYGTNYMWGIFTDFSDNLLIENNECYGSVIQHGIYVSNSCVDPVIRGNVVHDNFGAGIHMNGDLSQGGVGLITGALIENNVIYSNGAGGGAGINMDGVQNSTIRNNVLFDNHASGITMFQIDGASGPQGDQVFHNTVDMAADGRWALVISNTAGRNAVRNNVLYNRNTAHGGLVLGAATDVNNVDSDYNIQDWISTDDGATRQSLAQWQAQGHELHSLSATPDTLFVNAATGDYHLRSGSPAIDGGQTLSDVAVDMDGNPRPLGIASDIGCYEYTGATANSAALSALTISPSTVKGGKSAAGAVYISAPAPSGGIVVALSDNSASATVPNSVTVPAGQTTATFAIATKHVPRTSVVTITATYGGVTRSASITLTK